MSEALTITNLPTTIYLCLGDLGDGMPTADFSELSTDDVAWCDHRVDMHDQQYVRRDIFDAYRKAVDAWDKWLDGSLDGHDVACLIKAARQAGESVK